MIFMTSITSLTSIPFLCSEQQGAHAKALEMFQGGYSEQSYGLILQIL